MAKLKRHLGFADVFSIAAGAMISSGLFVLPGIAFAKAGPAIILAYLLAAVLVVPAMLSKAELATAMPKSGGDYFFIERSLGGYAGTLGGMASWLSLSFKSAFALIGIGAFAQLTLGDVAAGQLKTVAVACCLLVMGLNLLGAKMAGRFQNGLVFGVLAALILYVLVGVRHVRVEAYTPFAPHGLSAVFATAGLVFVSYGGLTKIASVAEEVKRPRRNLPRGMFAAFLVVSLMYVLAVFVTVGLVGLAGLSGSLTPISLGAGAVMGGWGAAILAAAALGAFVTTGNAGILSASRFPMAMSRDQLLPGFLGQVNKRFGTPHVSIVVTTAFVVAAMLFLDLENFVKTASTMKILLFMFVNLSVIIMRESKVRNYRPTFRSPLYPWLQIGGIVAYGFLIFEMGRVPLLITAGFVACGLLWHRVYARSRRDRQAALIHVVERVTDRRLASRRLESELREILLERDSITEDRFDRLIRKCTISDFEERMDAQAFFQAISRQLAGELNMDEQALLGLFVEREKQSSTVIQPGLAIPHIVIPGSHAFGILLARCRPGILFEGSQEPVHTVFVLLGSADERNYHLRALMAIAQIVREPEFEQRWLAARNVEELRDIILLSSRKREA